MYKKLDRADVRQMRKVTDEENSPPLGPGHGGSRKIFTQAQCAGKPRLTGQVVDRVRFFLRNGEDAIRRGVRVQFPDHLGSVRRIQRSGCSALAPFAENAPRVAQEMQINRVHDNARGGRDPTDNGDVRFGNVPQAKDGEVEMHLSDELFDPDFRTGIDGNAALLQDAGVTRVIFRMIGDEGDDPPGFLQESDEVQNAPRAGVAVELGHQGANQGAPQGHRFAPPARPSWSANACQVARSK